MKSFLKLLRKHWKKIALGLVLGVVLLLALVRMMLPGIIRRQVESIGGKTLGVPVTLDRVRLSLLGGSVALEGLTVASPQGFAATPFLTLAQLHANIAVSSLTSDRIIIEKVGVHGLEVTGQVDAQGRQSLQVLLAAAAKQKDSKDGKDKEEQDEPAADETPAEEKPGKTLELRRFEMTKLRLVSLDSFAAPEPVTAALSFDAFTLGNVVLSQPAAAKRGEVMRIGLAGLKLGVSGEYSKPNILRLDDLQIALDLGTLIASGGETEVIVPEIKLTGLDSHTEEPRDRARNNTKVFQAAMTNAFAPAAPKRLDGSEREDPAPADESAPATVAQETAPSESSPQGEEKKGALRRVEVAVLDLSAIDARTIRDGTTRLSVSKGALLLKDFTYADNRVAGEVTFQVDGFDYDVASNREANVFLAPLRLMLSAGVGKSPVVFDVPTRVRSPREFLISLIRGIQAKALPGSEIVTDAVGAASEAVGEAVGAVGGVAGDALRTGTGAVEDAAKGIGGAAGRVGESIGGLFNRRKDEKEANPEEVAPEK